MLGEYVRHACHVSYNCFISILRRFRQHKNANEVIKVIDRSEAKPQTLSSFDLTMLKRQRSNVTL